MVVLTRSFRADGDNFVGIARDSTLGDQEKYDILLKTPTGQVLTENRHLHRTAMRDTDQLAEATSSEYASSLHVWCRWRCERLAAAANGS